jgi:hypothetical protein
MIKKYVFLYITIICITLSTKSMAADTTFKKFVLQESAWLKKKEVGLNFTTLLHSFVPFNLGTIDPGATGIRFKFYEKRYAFRINFGTSLASNRATTTTSRDFFYFSIGYERRRIIGNRFAYTSGWDIFSSKGLLPEAPTEGLSGCSKHYGIEYHLTNACYIGTDAQILLGVGNTASVRFNYPNSIYFNIRF